MPKLKFRLGRYRDGMLPSSQAKDGGGLPARYIPKEVTPMSITETIALLMLVLAAMTLGANLKK